MNKKFLSFLAFGLLISSSIFTADADSDLLSEYSEYDALMDAIMRSIPKDQLREAKEDDQMSVATEMLGRKKNKNTKNKPTEPTKTVKEHLVGYQARIDTTTTEKELKVLGAIYAKEFNTIKQSKKINQNQTNQMNALALARKKIAEKLTTLQTAKGKTKIEQRISAEEEAQELVRKQEEEAQQIAAKKLQAIEDKKKEEEKLKLEQENRQKNTENFIFYLTKIAMKKASEKDNPEAFKARLEEFINSFDTTEFLEFIMGSNTIKITLTKPLKMHGTVILKKIIADPSKPESFFKTFIIETGSALLTAEKNNLLSENEELSQLLTRIATHQTSTPEPAEEETHQEPIKMSRSFKEAFDIGIGTQLLALGVDPTEELTPKKMRDLIPLCQKKIALENIKSKKYNTLPEIFRGKDQIRPYPDDIDQLFYLSAKHQKRATVHACPVCGNIQETPCTIQRRNNPRYIELNKAEIEQMMEKLTEIIDFAQSDEGQESGIDLGKKIPSAPGIYNLFLSLAHKGQADNGGTRDTNASRLGQLAFQFRALATTEFEHTE